MKYSVTRNEIRKRELIKVKNLDMDHNTGLWKYLKEKNLFIDYVFESGLAGNIHVPCEFNERDIATQKVDEFTYKDKNYVVLKEPLNYTSVYELLDKVHNTELMMWQDNKKYGTKDCKFESGMFEFHCICQKDNTVMIDVKYTKCDNKHKNKVTVSTIEVKDADNKRILEAVDEWKESFLSDVNNVSV